MKVFNIFKLVKEQQKEIEGLRISQDKLEDLLDQNIAMSTVIKSLKKDYEELKNKISDNKVESTEEIIKSLVKPEYVDDGRIFIDAVPQFQKDYVIASLTSIKGDKNNG